MINLIYNKDIIELEKKSNLNQKELQIIQLKGLLETKIQQRCKNILESLSYTLERKFKKKLIEFVHIDNGGKMGIRQKMKKKAEGVKKGFPDSAIFCGSLCGKYNKTIFVEFKRVGTPSQIDISKEQKYYNEWLNLIGYKAYITNNPIFFEDVICKEIINFYNI